MQAAENGGQDDWPMAVRKPAPISDGQPLPYGWITAVSNILSKSLSENVGAGFQPAGEGGILPPVPGQTRG
jgi:hypothetical protein